MTTIKVPTPPKSAYNPHRPLTSLLKAHIEHLHDAEKRLPPQFRSDMYVNAIQSEGEAANYIRQVTEAIHSAHEDARRARHIVTRKRGLEIAAVAGVRVERKHPARRAARKTARIKRTHSSGKKRRAR